MKKSLFILLGLMLVFPVLAANNIPELDQLLEQGEQAYNHSDYPTALTHWQAGLKRARELKHQKYISQFVGNIGAVYGSLGQYDKALNYFQQALTIRRDLGEKSGEGAESNIGMVYDNLGQYDKALNSYQQALTIHRDLGDKRGEGKDLGNIGVVYQNLGQYDKALDYYQQVLTIDRQIGDKSGEGKDLGSLGAVYGTLGQYDKALDYSQQALTIHRQIGDKRGEAANLTNLGVVYRNLGQYDKALDYYQQALTIRRQIGDKRGEDKDLTNLGVLYWYLGQYDKALDYCQQALTIDRQIGDKSGEGKDLINLGVVYDSLGQYDKALDYSQQALLLSSQVGAPESLWRTWDNLSKITAQLKNPSVAIFYGKQAVNVIQAMRHSVSQLQDKTLQQSFLKDKKKVYHHLADLLITQGRLFEAQQVLAMLKEEEYFDFIRRTRGKDSLNTQADYNRVEQPWAQRYEQIKTQLVSLRQEYDFLARKEKSGLDPLDPNEQRFTQVEEDLEVAGTALTAFLAFLDELKTTLAPEKVDDLNGLESLQDTLKKLGAGTVLIHYLVMEDKLHIIVTTPHIIVNRSVAVKEGDLNSTLLEFRKNIQDSATQVRGKLETPTTPVDQQQAKTLPETPTTPVDINTLQQQAKTLYNWLIQPIAEDLIQANAQVLMVYLDKALRYLPLAALHDGQHWLAERYALAIYTAAAMANLKGLLQPVWTVAGLGVSNATGGFSALPAVVSELRGIVRKDAQDKDGVLGGIIRLNDEFDEEALRKAFRNYPVVHIASHFFFKTGSYVDSFLLLGTGNKLSLKAFNEGEFESKNLDLFTLSACNTAMGNVGNGSEVESFGTLAQNHGAKSVLATLWAVNDTSTGSFMQLLYRSHNENSLNKNPLNKAKALQHAQQAFIQAGQKNSPYPKNYAHPFHWAPFILMENWL